MGKKYTKAQAKASAKYMEKMTTIRAVVTPERKAIIEAHALKHDGSVSAFINRAITEAMERD